jgi:hypothetical protein
MSRSSQTEHESFRRFLVYKKLTFKKPQSKVALRICLARMHPILGSGFL